MLKTETNVVSLLKSESSSILELTEIEELIDQNKELQNPQLPADGSSYVSSLCSWIL
jgi:hypothetical protein